MAHHPTSSQPPSCGRRRHVAAALAVPLCVAVLLSAVPRVFAQAAQPPKQEPARQPPPDPNDVLQVEEQVEVVAVTPLVNARVPGRALPTFVERIDGDTLSRPERPDLLSVLTTRRADAYGADVQNNPFQPDLQLRGFNASPLLGASQGVAVYQDGVRMNEPFGDTVQWDLLPANAIASLDVVPGSNPLFGLNALGGALSFATKSGRTHPGTRATVAGGSFARRRVAVETGLRRGRFDLFVAGQALEEDGWRDFSPSTLRQLFARGGYQTERSSIDVMISGAANDLTGNGATPVQLLEENRRSIFTYPDETRTRALLVTSTFHRQMSASTLFDAVVYHRRSRLRTFNGDEAALEPCEEEDVEGFLCVDDDDEEAALSVDGRPLPAIVNGRAVDAANNRSRTNTNATGTTLQVLRRIARGPRTHHVVAGGSIDASSTTFGLDSEIAFLEPDRGTTGLGLVHDASRVALDARVRSAAVFGAAFVQLLPSLTLSGAVRAHASELELRDRIGTELTGDHSFRRANPSIGVAWRIAPAIDLFGGYAQSSRVPTPVELTCADPEDPCRLPNAFVSDPPLDEVVAGGWEAGARGQHTAGIAWHASVYTSAVRDDIIFVSSGPRRNQGHFTNIDRTRRSGMEAALSRRFAADRLQARASWAYTRATFAVPLTLSSPNNPFAVDGEIAVEKGDRLPGLPAHRATFELIAQPDPATTIGVEAATHSSIVLRGDEGNLDEAIPGTAVFALHARRRIAGPLWVSGRVSNLFNQSYETFGLYGEPDEVLGGDYDDPRFLNPAAPRAAWIGIEVLW